MTFSPTVTGLSTNDDGRITFSGSFSGARLITTTAIVTYSRGVTYTATATVNIRPATAADNQTPDVGEPSIHTGNGDPTEEQQGEQTNP